MVAAGFVSGQPIGRVGCVTTGKTTDGSWHGCHGTLGGGGGTASSPKFRWGRRGLEFLYPLKWRRFDTVNFFFKIIIEISDSQVKLSVQPVRFRFNLFLGQLTGLD